MIDSPGLPRRYNYAEAAERVGRSKSWLAHNIKRLPHVRIGGRVEFTDQDLIEIVEMHRQRPGRPKLAPATRRRTY